MDFEWDDNKSQACRIARGFGFEIVYDFDWETAVVNRDERYDYGEDRYRAFGWVADKVFCIAFTHRDTALRIVSVRRTHKQEAMRYGFKKI